MTQLDSVQLSSIKLGLAYISMTELDLVQLSMTELDLAQLSLTQLDSAQPGLTWLDSAHHNSSINIRPFCSNSFEFLITKFLDVRKTGDVSCYLGT